MPDSLKLMKRTSRSAFGDYQHTWVEVTTVSEAMAAQVWDIPAPDDQDHIDHGNTAGNPHNTSAEDVGALPASGGSMTGALGVRTLDAAPDDYASTEAVPRSWIDTQLDAIRSITESIIQSHTNIFSQIDNLRTRVEILEASLLGVRGFIYTQATAALSWIVTHNFNNVNVIVSTFEGDVVVWPKEVRVVDANSVQIDFSVPVAGRAEIIPVVQYGT